MTEAQKEADERYMRTLDDLVTCKSRDEWLAAAGSVPFLCDPVRARQGVGTAEIWAVSYTQATPGAWKFTIVIEHIGGANDRMIVSGNINLTGRVPDAQFCIAALCAAMSQPASHPLTVETCAFRLLPYRQRRRNPWRAYLPRLPLYLALQMIYSYTPPVTHPTHRRGCLR
jgi:hypothetical protein